MTKLDILKTFLNEEELMEQYEISQDQIDNIHFPPPFHSNDMIALLQHTVNTLENGSFTINTAAGNINNFLEARLRDRQ